MDISHSTIILLPILTFLLFPPSSIPASSDYSTLVYKTCNASQTFNDQLLLSQSHSQTLTSLFQQLIAQSSRAKFFQTMELIKDDNTAIISGLFQCRNDLTTEDCFTCVNSSLPHHVSNTLCIGSTSARVQLEGCYIQYETMDLSQTIGDVQIQGKGEISSKSSNNYNLLHKVCGEPIITAGAYVKFRELMDEAFVALKTEIVNSDGYCRTSYESVELMAQCEGDSGACECSECISDAVLVAKEECGGSVSAQIYLDKCFISYVYHSKSGASSNNNTAKLTAIVLGGAAVLVLGLIFVSLLNSRLKKDDFE